MTGACPHIPIANAENIGQNGLMATLSARPSYRNGACRRGVEVARPVFAAASRSALLAGLLAGCSHGGYPGGGSDASVRNPQGPPDLALTDLASSDLAGSGDLRSPADFATKADGAAPSDLGSGPITGGPCMSGASGATALRVHWTMAGSTAMVNYEVEGLPDKTRSKVSVAGYVIPFTPQFADPFLGSGGVALDDSDFIDVEISTAGVHHMTSVTLALFGRSYSVDTSGSFNWMTFTGSGSTATDYVSNVAPYSWYPADATTDIAPDDSGVYMRIKAGGSSDSLVVNRLELCIDAS
jgi:hypothetical protein